MKCVVDHLAHHPGDLDAHVGGGGDVTKATAAQSEPRPSRGGAAARVDSLQDGRRRVDILQEQNKGCELAAITERKPWVESSLEAQVSQNS